MSIPISGLPAAPNILGTDKVAMSRGTGVTYGATIDQLTENMVTQTACRAATTADLTATYDNGNFGIGAKLTNASALAALTIDTVVLVVGDRVLVKDQTNQEENGIYIVTIVGSGSIAWVMTRATDYDQASDVTSGDFFTIGAEGAVNGKTQWIQLEDISVMGAENIIFESNIVAGAGITKTNNSISTTSTLASGTYTPTLTNVANLDASTPYQCQYMRVGSVVTVSGLVDIDPTAGAAATELGISLPIASDFANAQNCAGTAFCPTVATQGAAILGDPTNNRAQLTFVSGNTSNQSMYFTFSYVII